MSLEKLVRDDIPDIIKADGGVPVTRKLHGHGFVGGLIDKAIEELEELRGALELDETVQSVEPGELVTTAATEERADVHEALRKLDKVVGFSGHDVMVAAEAKRKSRGGFEQGIFLERIDWPNEE